MKRTLSLILSVALAVLPLRAQNKQDPFVFSPQWTAQAQFAGYYVAKEKGFYDEEGVDVEIVHPFTTESTGQRIQSPKITAVAMPLVEAIQYNDEGVELVNILQTSMNSATMLISRYGNDPLKLRKAKVATWRAGYSQLPYCLVKEMGLDYEGIPAASSVNIFIAGAVDACLAMSYNEYYQIMQAGLLHDGKGVCRLSENGYNVQEDGVWMTKAKWMKEKDRAERFARASRRGWEWAAGHPDETLDIVMEYVERFRIATNRTLQWLMLEEILRQQLDPDTGQREFRLRPDMVELAGKKMAEAGLISQEVPYEKLMP